MGPSMAQDNPSTALLTFLDSASNNLKSALQKPFRPKRKGSHYCRKYIRRSQISKKSPGHGSTYERTTSTNTNEQQQSMDALFKYQENSSPIRVPDSQIDKPLRLRNLPPSFFNEPLKSFCNSPDFCSNPLEDLLGPNSPMEELLSSPTWKAIVAHSKTNFSYQQHHGLDECHSPLPVSNSVFNQPSCRYQETPFSECENGSSFGFDRRFTTDNNLSAYERTAQSQTYEKEYSCYTDSISLPSQKGSDWISQWNAESIYGADFSMRNECDFNSFYGQTELFNCMATVWTDPEKTVREDFECERENHQGDFYQRTENAYYTNNGNSSIYDL